jgi:dTDP-4-dehydrorhamnose reductase
MNKVLITGHHGQLGSIFHDLIRNIKWADFEFSSTDILNLTNRNSIRQFFNNRHFDYIVNCAAYTAVDKAESDRDKAFQLNAEAPGLLAMEAAKAGAVLIHISTDYVFGGQHCKPLKPDDPKAPASVYGKSKLRGEEAVMAHNPKSMIIRTSWLYSRYGQNFLKTMLRLGGERNSLNVVFDQTGTPTLADDLAGAILCIIEKVVSKEKKFVPGIYHFSNEGVCSWYDFAVAIFEIANLNCKVIPVESDQFPTPAPRPFYSVMDKSLIRSTYGIEIAHWQASLKKCLPEMLKA